MKRSNRLVILVGILLAVLAFVGIVVVLNQNQAGQQVGPTMATVLVAANDIAIGDPVTPDAVETREVEADAVLGNALTDASQAQGQPALFAIPAGTQVTQAALGLGVGAQNVSGQLLDGERAIAFVVDRVQGADFLVQAGDTVDVIATVHLLVDASDDVVDEVRSVKTVLQNKRVLYVSNSRMQAAAAATPAPDGEPVAPAPVFDSVVIIIAGTDQDAEVIRFVQRTASQIGDHVASAISVTLRAPGDDSLETTSGITIEQLIDTYGLLIPDMGPLEDLQGAVSSPEPAP
ncbi:MAG: Flp pilus assembly protein CpaB [Candidatus Limnocylindria bacterium]